MSQIVDYDDKGLEKLSLYARNLRPMLREALIEEDEIDLNSVVLSHYRLSKIRQQDIQLKEDSGEFLSQIIGRLNELFITDELSDKDLVNYAYTVRDKLSENALVMSQIANNTPEQAMLGDFPKAIDDVVMDSNEAHQNQMLQLLSDPAKAAGFARVVFDLLSQSQK